MSQDKPPKQARSGIASENIQEVLDAEDSSRWATLQGQNQYFTPVPWAERFAAALPDQQPGTVLDPQCGDGATITTLKHWRTDRYGIDLDNRVTGLAHNLITGNCVKVTEALDDISPGLVWDCINANPPFGKRWKVGDKVIDSTQWTWNFCITHGRYGYFISNYKTIERLGIHQHPYVYKYEKHENVWDNCEVVIGVVWWHNKAAQATETVDLDTAWNAVGQIIEEEKAKLPPFNIWLDAQGKFKTYLSTRAKVKKKLKRDEILRLDKVNGQHPCTLTTEYETRKLLNQLIECGFYDIQPEARAAIQQALDNAVLIACPIMPPKDFELVAYTQEQEHLKCIHENTLGFTVGQQYELSTASYNFTEHIKRNKPHYNEETKTTYSVVHECTLSGQDRYIQLVNDAKVAHRFLDRPDKDSPQTQHEEAVLWTIFEKPVVQTIADRYPALIETNLKILRSCELMAGFQYYPGQLEYLARVGAKDNALIGADTGTGKTLMAITMIALKGPQRALIIAPQGTMRSSDSEGNEDEEETEYQASQWLTELRTFAPFLQIFELFSMDDYQRILDANHGKLPPGVYVSYYQAMFLNKARESCPETWTDPKLAKLVQEKYEIDVPPHPSNPTDGWCSTIGEERNGIRCLIAPCMSTLIGHHFDMVLLDEAHLACHLETNITQMLIRLQPRYRYALTATPIPNIVSNLFSLMGWLCVPDWYKGDRRNSAWPYARQEIGTMESTFLSHERDYTQENMDRAANKEWRGQCVKKSPVISSPARLLKLLKPTLAHISKEACNPNVVPCKIIDVRVPMGREQSMLYGHFLNRGNIPCRHPLIRARKQIAWLRGVCADPAGFAHGGPKVHSNYNPKTIAMLEITRQLLAKGEQVVIVNARIGQTNTIHWKLRDAKVPIARIDSTVPPAMHAAQANLFKNGKARVMLMGIKCAVGYSFPLCPNLIIGSLEYSYGSLAQAKGRVWRVNSKFPVTIWCILHDSSIETLMFDNVATKEDAATICLLGQRAPRDFKPVDAEEILADAITKFAYSDQPKEEELEAQWPKLCQSIASAVSGLPVMKIA